MSNVPVDQNSDYIMIPELNGSPSVKLFTGNIKSAETRFIDAKNVNWATYNELEYSFNEGYREAKKNLVDIGYALSRTAKLQNERKSLLILDEYPDFLKMKAMKDSATVRDAFIEKDELYTNYQNRFDQLKAMEAMMEGKIKVFENVCRFIRKTIDIEVRSGIGNYK